jgi:hypothetical protein
MLLEACFPEWTIHPAVWRITIEPGERREIESGRHRSDHRIRWSGEDYSLRLASG